MMLPKHNNVTAVKRNGQAKNIIHVPHQPEDCRAVVSVLALIGDKWSVLIIVVLGNGPVRFNQIKRLIGGISQRMLTLTLRELEREGLVTRTPFPTIPPRVDYALTALGHSLLQVVEPLGAWARAHIIDMKTARENFDKRSGRTVS